MMPLNRPLIADVDDTVLDWMLGGFRPDFQRRTQTLICPDGSPDWDLSGWLGVSFDEMLEHVKAFNTSEAFGQLPALPCAQVILPEIARTGREIHIVTSCARDAVTQKRRRDNLERLFGDIFASITCLDLGESKETPLKTLAEHTGNPGLWVEDNHKNAVIGAEIGHTTFVMRRSHNRKIEPVCTRADLTWVDTWFDIAPHLLPTIPSHT